MHRTRIAPLSIATALIFSAACAAASPKLNHRLGPYTLNVVVGGRAQPVYGHRGESYVLGRLGQRYTLRVHNHSGRRVEAVVTVDGRDVLDGKPGNWSKRGYLIPAWGSVDIDGWRLSRAQVAAFRFSSVADSYAARTGSARDVGVVGVAIFPERHTPVYSAPPAPEDDEYSGYGGGYDYDGRDRSSQAQPSERSKKPARAEAAPSSPQGARGDLGKSLESRHRHESERPGLATGFGERRHSPVREVTFARLNANRPSALLGVRYNSRRGLIAMGVDLYQHSRRDDVALRRSASPFPEEHPRYVAPPPGWND